SQEVFELLNRKDYRRAVLMSDGIFYDLLRQFGYLGNSLGEIANSNQSESIPNIGDIRKLAAVAEEMKKNKNYPVDIEQMKDIFDSFEDTLRKMDVITEEDD
ncbi:MAG: hypothetical protein PHG20_13060, partial [Geobacteraceae bacterium]|nr:hypothetical protein [Geobacteraceae bacterium]